MEDPDAAPHPDDNLPDDATLAVEIVDTHVSFTGTLSKLAFAAKSAALEVTFTIPPEAPITNRDLLYLRHRLAAIVITPVSRSGGMVGGVSSSGSALSDPVASAVTAARLNRAAAGWTVEAPYDHAHD
jgi:hypothetical protein